MQVQGCSMLGVVDSLERQAKGISDDLARRLLGVWLDIGSQSPGLVTRPGLAEPGLLLHEQMAQESSGILRTFEDGPLHDSLRWYAAHSLTLEMV